jgi:outer membrane protein assembly factor BamD
MKRHGAIALAFILLASLLSGCMSMFEKEEEKTRNWSASQFYSKASGALAEGDYETAIKYYELLEARYPFGRYAMQAQLDVAYAYYKDGEPDSAIAAADRFIRINPSDPHVDYAYYLKGLSNFNRSIDIMTRFLPTDLSQRDAGAAYESFNDFAELIRRYPDSQYAPDARKRLIYLRNLIAQQEVHVAQYYMKRGAYLAAANRCKEVVEKYPRTPAVEEALELMIDAYTRLKLDDLATDAKRVLAYNREKGTFEKAEKPEDPSMTRVVWDYIGLDKN